MTIGLILGGTAIWLAYETKGLLIGEAAEPDVVSGIRNLAASSQHVTKVNEVLTMNMGPEFVLVNISVDFRDDLEIGEVERAIAELDRIVKASYPPAKRVFIEAESAAAYSRSRSKAATVESSEGEPPS